MNINRSHIVDQFKRNGQGWYKSAQHLPIDVYKDILLFYQFIETVLLLVERKHYTKEQLITLIQDRHQAYRRQNYDHPQYGGLIEMMHRRKIGSDYAKSFLQSMLLRSNHIQYRNEDELKVYIHGIAESLGIVICDIIGSAPGIYPYVSSFGEALWIIHMLLDLHHDWPHHHYYIPQSILDRFGVTVEDIGGCCSSHIITTPVRDLVIYYINQHELLCNYALEGLSYLNESGRPGVIAITKQYEHITKLIISYNYNVFHPRFRHGLIAKAWGYRIYYLSTALGK